MNAILLPTTELASRIADLPGWALEGKEIVRSFSFPSYLAGLNFVHAVAQEAEVMNHHPDLLLSWRKVTVRLTTHSAGGITALDFALAEFCSRI